MDQRRKRCPGPPPAHRSRDCQRRNRQKPLTQWASDRDQTHRFASGLVEIARHGGGRCVNHEALSRETERKQGKQEKEGGRHRSHEQARASEPPQHRQGIAAEIGPVDHAPEPDQAKGAAHGGDCEDHAEFAVGEAKLGPDVRIKDRYNVGLAKAGKKREKKTKGKEPKVANDEPKIVQIGPCAPQNIILSVHGELAISHAQPQNLIYEAYLPASCGVNLPSSPFSACSSRVSRDQVRFRSSLT